MEKRAYYIGKAQALRTLGFTEETVKTAFVQEGLSVDTAQFLIKEAFWGTAASLLGRGILGAGRMLAGGAGRLAAGGAARAAAPGVGRAGQLLGKGMQTAGQLGQKAGRGISRSGIAFARNPAKAVGKGAWNFGQGAMMGQGGGMGGTLGKGMFGYQVANMMAPGGQTPQVPMPYGQYGQ